MINKLLKKLNILKQRFALKIKETSSRYKYFILKQLDKALELTITTLIVLIVIKIVGAL